MKQKINIILISFIFVFTLIGVTSFLTYQSIKVSPQKEQVQEEVIASVEKTKLRKEKRKIFITMKLKIMKEI